MGVLSDRKRTTFFAGHLHNYRKVVENGRSLYRLATTGGLSELTGADDGRFDHIVWVTMTEEEPIIANILLDGIWADDPVIEAGQRVTRDYPKMVMKATGFRSSISAGKSE